MEVSPRSDVSKAGVGGEPPLIGSHRRTLVLDLLCPGAAFIAVE